MPVPLRGAPGTSEMKMSEPPKVEAQKIEAPKTECKSGLG